MQAGKVIYTDEHWVTVEPVPRRVRVMAGGEFIADSKRVKLLRENRHLPVYYFPEEDVRTELLKPSDKKTKCPVKGEAPHWHVEINGRTIEDAVWGYPEPLEQAEGVRKHYAFYWNKMDRWFEEDEEIYVHPRDPYKRVDALESGRHVRIDIFGTTVAESDRPVVLFETGLPPRYYLPKADVRLDLLVPSDKRTECPYKGTASYYSVKIGDEEARDIVWYYTFPNPEVIKIKDRMCFFTEKLDEVYIDGQKLEKQKTPWS
jgi:uncharacterized protein (DUF427 family)